MQQASSPAPGQALKLPKISVLQADLLMSLGLVALWVVIHFLG